MFLTTRGLVLREVKYRDSDKLLTVLTEDEGKLTVKARGALRKGCRYAAATQALVLSEMTLFGSRGRWSLNEAETVEQFLPLRTDLELLALGTYFAEALEAVSDEDNQEREILQLGLNSLYALSHGLYSQEHIKSVFELRLMCLSGFEPDLYGCAVCGKEDPVDAVFSLNGGILHCKKCMPNEALGIRLPISQATLCAMRYIALAEPKRIFSFSVGVTDERQLSGTCEAYMEAQLERGFRSLDYWKTLKYRG